MRTDREFEHRGAAIGDEDLDALERSLGVRLPASYRSFLLEVDGGCLRERNGFDVGRDNGSTLHILYSVRHEDEYYTIAAQRFAFEGRLPGGLLAIGEDPGGNLICLGVAEDNHGAVFFWDMEDERETPSRRNVYPIAEDFARFLEALYESE